MKSKEIADNGLNLLKKGKQGIVHALFGRVGLLVLSLLLQAGILLGLVLRFRDMIPIYLGGSIVFTFCILLCLVNSAMDPSAKITWLIVIMVLPVFGCFFYIWTQSEWGHRALEKSVRRSEQLSKDLIHQKEDTLKALAQSDPGAAGLARYIARTGLFPVYDKTDVTYFPLGEDKWKQMLRELENARKFIYLEYFIVDEGLMWGRILEILARKAKELSLIHI